MIFSDPTSPASVTDDCIVGTTTAIALGLIGAGTSLGGSAIAAHGAHSAANTQVQAANDARAYYNQMYQTGRADLEPWMQAGGDARAKLADMLQLPGAGASATPRASLPPGERVGNGAALSTFARAAVPAAVRMAPGGATKPDVPMVMLKAPDGATRAVPADQAQRYIALGAQRVG